MSLPGNVTTLIANELVTKHASPNASVQRTKIDAQKKIRPEGIKLRNPNRIVEMPVTSRPATNILFEPIAAI